MDKTLRIYLLLISVSTVAVLYALYSLTGVKSKITALEKAQSTTAPAAGAATAASAIYKLVGVDGAAGLTATSSTNTQPIPATAATVLPLPYSVQYTPDANLVFAVADEGHWVFELSGVFANGSTAMANNYIGVTMTYTQGTATYASQGTQICAPGSFGYSAQATVQAYMKKGDTVTPTLFNFSGNTMKFFFKSFTARRLAA